MLFKTRVGLCVLGENTEIRVFPPTGSKTWHVIAQHRSGPEIESRSFLGRSVKLAGVWFHLAAFIDHANVETDVGTTMQIIAEAYAGSAPVCDLSHVGSAEAWREMSEQWALVRWP